MANLKHIFRPKTFDDIVGQPVEDLKIMMQSPQASCWMLTGDPGTGKTITTKVVAEMLGCTDPWFGLHQFACASFGIDQVKVLFNEDLRLYSPSSSGFHLVILNECEWLSPQVQRFLKNALDPETDFPGNTIVMGTTNDTDGIDPALLERFRLLSFQSNESFAASCRQKIANIWQHVFQDNLPPGSEKWGYVKDRFSMRVATQQAEDAMQRMLQTC